MAHSIYALLLGVLLLALFGAQIADTCSVTGIWQGTTETLILGAGTSFTTVPVSTSAGTTTVSSNIAITRNITNYEVVFDAPGIGVMTGASVISPTDLSATSQATFLSDFRWNTSKNPRCVSRWWGSYVVTQVALLQVNITVSPTTLSCTTCDDTQSFSSSSSGSNCNSLLSVNINNNNNKKNSVDFYTFGVSPNGVTADVNTNYVLNGSVCLGVPGLPINMLLTFSSDCAAFATESGLLYTLNSTQIAVQPGNPIGAQQILSDPNANSCGNSTSGRCSPNFVGTTGGSFSLNSGTVFSVSLALLFSALAAALQL